ncbi:MAG: hypothetical protein IJ429_02125 [Lachnospiraceae bacterium]|nr:hypothetical protein [Lachnospiraceae bacterium]
MDLNTFAFYMETIPTEVLTHQDCIDFALRCYNLFLAFFYFNIIKYFVTTAQRCMRRMSKFTRGL